MSLSWEVLPADTPRRRRYCDVATDQFSLPVTWKPNTTILALLDDSDFVGGVTFDVYDSLGLDPDLALHWHVRKDLAAVRLSRLWNRGNLVTLARLFDAIAVHCRTECPGAFLYGVQSMSLTFARSRAWSFERHLALLEPRMALADCHWPPGLPPSSNGERLVNGYLHRGAQVLGPPSGCPQDNSVRVALGIWEPRIAQQVSARPT